MHLKKQHLCYGKVSISLGKLWNCCASTLLWVVLKTILHKLYEIQVGLGWLHEQNHGWCTNDVPLQQQSPINHPELWQGLVQCFDLYWSFMGILIVLHQWHLCDHSWIWLYICTHFAMVKHCFHIVLEVCDGFICLVHFQSTKFISLHTALLCSGAHSKQSSHVHSATMTLQLAGQGQKYFAIMYGACASTWMQNKQYNQLNKL